MGAPKAGPLKYRLAQVNGDRSLDLETSNILGRESGLLTETMSRRHVQLEQKKGRWFVADLSSTNGTRLNGKPMREREWYPLTLKDTIEFGDMQFRLVEYAAEEETLAGEATDVGAAKTSSTNEEWVPDSEKGGEAEVAGFFIRWAAAFIDSVCMSIVSGVLQFVFAAISPSPILQTLGSGLSFFLVAVLPVALYGRTAGKKALGLWVVTKEGEYPTWGRVLLREVVGKVLLFVVAPAIVAGIVAALLKSTPAVGVLVLIWFVIAAFMYRKHGEPFWDKLFKTQVTRYK